MTPSEVARAIDHALLKPEATASQIDALCDEAVRYGFGAVCINPVWVGRVAKRLDAMPREERPGVVSVAGFPLGASTTATKSDEARRAIGDGATEIDMVVDVGSLLDGDGPSVRADIAAVARAVHGSLHDGVLKVILETRVLTDDRIILGCRCCAEGEADFVKTSTGFHPGGGATVSHVRLLHRSASPIRVKASGGIRCAADALAMLEAGASRLGTSAGVAILSQMRGDNP